MTQTQFVRNIHRQLQFPIMALAATLLAHGARAASIPLTADHWAFQEGKAEFAEHRGTPAIRVRQGAGQVVLKDFSFTNGTIEFDVQPDRPDFVSLYFRRQDKNESELVYLRTFGAGKLGAADTVQYSPMVKGVNLWDLLGHYQASPPIRSNEWTHVKLVVSGAQLRVYVNDLSEPVLEVPRLEGNTSQGGLAVEGSAYFANLQVKPDVVEGLTATAGIDPTHNDPRYLRHWEVSTQASLPPGRELWQGALPPKDTQWNAIAAERRGLIDLTRQFGNSESRRVVWLRTKVRAAAEQTRRLELGFSDEVWVFVNGGLAHVDKNIYTQPVRKSPNGRLALENTACNLPLKAGDNELLIGVANDFYGWGIAARIDKLEGIELQAVAKN